MLNEKLSSIIDQIVEDKTFSLEAVNAIKEMRELIPVLEDEIKKKNNCLDTERMDNDALRSTINELQAKIVEKSGVINEWVARDAALIDREKSMTKLEVEREMLGTFKGELYDLLCGLFKNPTKVREIQDTENVVVPGCNGGSSWVDSRSKNSRETETTQ